jgi:uncharacterized protein (TIGR03435 family)
MIVGGPSWIRSDRFDINAKAEGDPPRAQILMMVQQLLVDRFKLRSHVERRTVDVYALVKARADGRLGPRLRPNPVDCDALFAAQRAGGGQTLGPCARGGSALPPSGLTRTTGTWKISQLIGMFQSWMDRIVVDDTGLDGYYDFDLEFDFATRSAPDGNGGIGPSIFTALQEQLGLKLEPGRDAMDVLVIDSVERPTPD